jgi:hypothetical protein
VGELGRPSPVNDWLSPIFAAHPRWAGLRGRRGWRWGCSGRPGSEHLADRFCFCSNTKYDADLV